MENIETKMKETKKKFLALAEEKAELLLLNRIIEERWPELAVELQTFSRKRNSYSHHSHIFEMREGKIRKKVIEVNGQYLLGMEEIWNGAYNKISNPFITLSMLHLNEENELSYESHLLVSLRFCDPDFSKKEIVTGKLVLYYKEEELALVKKLTSRMEKIGISIQEEKRTGEKESMIEAEGVFQIKVE